ncbi:MAG: hypothetical protein A4E53_03372 [Pelotomaculum sp. PtaB.Bin104]|nr:MAG: hypothetical protein A4E53_03372 [Pelotomaculum sp. PtaB.Bin104]
MIMLKRLSVVTAVFFLLTAFISQALAGIPFDAITAINDAKQSYSDYYKDWSPYVPENAPEKDSGLHYVTDSGLSNLTDGNGYSYGFLAYGQPHGDQKDGQYRYIGYTFYGEDYTNMDFPADQNANRADFASQNWIIQPWDDSAVKESNPNLSKFNPVSLPGDGDSKYHTAILAGIMAYGATNANNGYTISSTSNPSFWDNIEQYVHILSPASQYSFGIGRMWHTDQNGDL